VYLKTPGFQEPPVALYYLVASNGIYLVKKTPLFASVTEAGAIHGLEPQAQAVTLAVPRVPREVMEAVYGFFLEAYRRWESEAVALLFLAPATGAFRVEIPPQTIVRYRAFGGWRTEQRVEYGPTERPKGHLKLGDLHSHAGMPPFFSHTDDRDDREDGLRVVVGRLDRVKPEVRVSFVSGRTRFSLDPEEVIEEFSDPVPPPDEWLAQITCRDQGEVSDEHRTRCWN
jgi:hypothetical protein